MGIEDADPKRWPNSKWRSLKVVFRLSLSLCYLCLVGHVIMEFSSCDGFPGEVG